MDVSREATKERARKKRRGPWRVVFWLALVVLIGSLSVLGYLIYTYWNGQKAYDDIVDVADGTGHVFGRGRAAAGSDLLQLAVGRSREEVAESRILAPLAERPVIHRDELVLFE